MSAGRQLELFDWYITPALFVVFKTYVAPVDMERWKVMGGRCVGTYRVEDIYRGGNGGKV